MLTLFTWIWFPFLLRYLNGRDEREVKKFGGNYLLYPRVQWGRGKAIIGNKIYSLFHEVAMAVGFVEDAEEREK